MTSFLAQRPVKSNLTHKGSLPFHDYISYDTLIREPSIPKKITCNSNINFK